MNYSKEDFKSLFQSKFDYAKWFTMLKDFFKADELRTQPESIFNPADCDKGYYIGAINTEDSYRIGLFYYEIGNSNVARKKVGLRNLVRTFINPNWGQFDAALAVFAGSDGLWRLSLISDIKGETTAAKRYTFVFGEKDNLYRTAIERFCLIRSEGVSFEVLRKAFSVEALTEEFFKFYKDHYERFCDFIYQNADDENYFGPEFAEWNSHENTQKHIRDYVKNLMGRIVFLQFLQKKGWMGVPTDSKEWVGGDPYFMQHLFDYATEKQREDFLDEVLEPLFFNCLNTFRPNDVFETNIKGIGAVKVPYLNGELFEQKEVDKAKSRFPQKYFHDLLNLFLQYNFTIDENDPNDAEIGVDPEMLGKIFENLLEDNKDKGAFYTPKEIVRYMCKESLIAYLCSHVAAKHEESIKTLVNNHLLTDKLQEDANTCKRLNKYLQDVKVCDPAIGSGAFPMGVMNEIFSCRRVLHDNIEEDVTAETQAQIKRDIIQNNIYGVDIEQGAVDIARLRFWLALVVDSVQPEPLPNFDYKIMQGNSLVESYKGLDLSNLLHSEDLFVSTKAQELPKLLRGYYRETDNEVKRKLRNEIDFTIKQCIYLAGFQDTVEIPNSDFFLWHTYFQEVFKDGGFDVVIGNPPYIQLQSNGGALSEQLHDKGYKTFAKTGDIYSLFYEKGWQVLKPMGVLCFITSNKWMRAAYGEKTRGFFAENTNPCLLIDFAGVKVFQSATVDTNILLFTKEKNKHQTICVSPQKGEKDILSNLSLFVQQKHTMCNFDSSNGWVILSEIEQSIKRKIEAVGTPLKDWDINIYRGVLTGCNEAFIINTEKRNEILSNCADEDERKRTEELIRPILRGRDIKRYGYEWADLWLINTHNGIKGKLERIHIEDYPAVKAHLDIYWDKISNRADKGDTPYNLRNCAYLDDFSKPKIVYPETTQGAYFAFDDKGLFIDKTCFMLISDDSQYLQHTLSSRLFEFAYKNIFSSIELGEHGYQYNKHALVKLPILKCYDNCILDDVQDIDKKIYTLYNISDDEIIFIESFIENQ